MQKDILYESLGFPIILRNCPIRRIRGAETPDIDLNELMQKVFATLITTPGRFTGGQVRFIRSYLELSQSEFGKMLNQSGHSVISLWESKKDAPTGMDFNTELILRQKMALKAKGVPLERVLREVLPSALQSSDPLEIDVQAA